MRANERQVAGDHYRSSYQHWDFTERVNLSYMEGCITKYLTRWRKKDGVEDLRKAVHFLDKMIEIKDDRDREVYDYCGVNDLGEEETAAVIALLVRKDYHEAILHIEDLIHSEPGPGYVDQD